MTVVASRVPAGESVLRPRSRCPSCGAEIRNRDNVPVVSWLLLRGRCRSCGERISARYPAAGARDRARSWSRGAAVYERVWVAVMVAAFLALMPAIAVDRHRAPHHPEPHHLSRVPRLRRLRGGGAALRRRDRPGAGAHRRAAVRRRAVHRRGDLAGHGHGRRQAGAVIGVVLGSIGLALRRRRGRRGRALRRSRRRRGPRRSGATASR